MSSAICHAEDASGEKALSKWSFISGVGDSFPKLKTSEADIDNKINRLGALLFPRWEDPDTFKDLRDASGLLDSEIGIDYAINSKWSWVSIAGYTKGNVKDDRRYYPLLIPTVFKTNFERKVWFMFSGVQYYPWGKSAYGLETGGRLKRSLKGARPFVNASLGYLVLEVKGSAKFDLPLIRRDVGITEAFNVYTLVVSPKTGIDIPINKKNDLILAASYSFFEENQDDLDGWALYIMHRYKFGKRNKAEKEDR